MLDKKTEIHRQNKITLARELERMSRLEDPYQHFTNASAITLGIWHLAAWYLSEGETSADEH